MQLQENQLIVLLNIVLNYHQYYYLKFYLVIFFHKSLKSIFFYLCVCACVWYLWKPEEGTD